MSLYRNIQASILRFCRDFGEQNGCSPFNLDASWDEGELPKADICGMLGLTFDIDEHFVDGAVQVGVSTWDDTNLMRLSTLVDKLLTELLPTKKIQIRDAETGAYLGLMAIKNGTKVMPVAGGKNRAVQMIGFSFATTDTYSLKEE